MEVIISILTLAILGVAILAADSYNAAKCAPPKNDIDIAPAFLLDCSKASFEVGVSLGTIGIADIIIFIVPLPIIAKLHLPLAKRIGITAVFLAGVL